MVPRRLVLVLSCLALLTGAGVGTSAASATAAGDGPGTPWRSAEAIRSGLFDAQAELILGTNATAARAVDRARSRYAGALRAGIRDADPELDRAIEGAFAAARRAARAKDATALSAARGGIRASLFRGSYDVTLAAVGLGDAAKARAWLLLREFRTATRFTRPGADATLAVRQLARGRITPPVARSIVAKDLLDAYQGRLLELLGDALRGNESNLPARRAEAAAQAEGYFAILADRYAQDLGRPAAARARATYAVLARAARHESGAAVARAQGDAVAALEGFTAAPFTEREAGRRAQQLLRFLALVPVEYGRGVKGDQVTRDFEIQEALAFQGGAAAALSDLQALLAKRDPGRTKAIAAQLEQLGKLVGDATQRTQGVAGADEIQQRSDAMEKALKATMPSAWQEQTDESDYDLIALTLDRMEASAGAGQYRQAEQARLEAYAFFEFGPERRLKAFDPGLALQVEGLVWFGADGKKGLATLIDKRAPRREIRDTRLALDEKLGDAAATLGDSANRTSVVTNSAILVFREGLEAVLILAALTASFVGVKRRMRRPVLIGAGLGLLVTAITWVLAQTLLGSLERYGERLEAIVGLVAIGVLLLITNWFFHRVYWSEWIGKFHRRRRALERFEKVGFVSAQALGLALLGMTSVYREGFETVLFLQSLQLSAGTATVLEGAGLGLAMALAVAVVTFALQRKLPYKKMLIVTGVMIGLVLVVMVGKTARTMQGAGWLSITPFDVEPAYWLGLWFGVYPTVETLGAQVAAMAFVIGSYFLAQELRVKRPQRRARRRDAAGTAAPAVAAPSGNGNAQADVPGSEEANREEALLPSTRRG